MISEAAGLCHFERSEKSALGNLLTADSSSHSLLGMTKLAGCNSFMHLHTALKQSIFAILALLLLLAASNCALSAQSLPEKTNPNLVRHELKQILSQPEYNRVYEEHKPPKWWTDFSRKAGQAIKNIFMWLSRTLGLQSGKAGRAASLIFACLVIIAFFALLVLIIRKLSIRLNATQEGENDGAGGRYELPSADPLISEAARLAELSDWRGAFRCVYLASISRLDETGALRFEKSRTNWEYLQDLDKTGRLSLRDQLKPLTGDFDRKFYGRESCDRDDYIRALDVYRSIAKEAAA